MNSNHTVHLVTVCFTRSFEVQGFLPVNSQKAHFTFKSHWSYWCHFFGWNHRRGRCHLALSSIVDVLISPSHRISSSTGAYEQMQGSTSTQFPQNQWILAHKYTAGYVKMCWAGCFFRWHWLLDTSIIDVSRVWDLAWTWPAQHIFASLAAFPTTNMCKSRNDLFQADPCI